MAPSLGTGGESPGKEPETEAEPSDRTQKTAFEKPGSGVRRLLTSADFVRSAGNFPLYWKNYFHA